MQDTWYTCTRGTRERFHVYRDFRAIFCNTNGKRAKTAQGRDLILEIPPRRGWLSRQPGSHGRGAAHTMPTVTHAGLRIVIEGAQAPPVTFDAGAIVLDCARFQGCVRFERDAVFADDALSRRPPGSARKDLRLDALESHLQQRREESPVLVVEGAHRYEGAGGDGARSGEAVNRVGGQVVDVAGTNAFTHVGEETVNPVVGETVNHVAGEAVNPAGENVVHIVREEPVAESDDDFEELEDEDESAQGPSQPHRDVLFSPPDSWRSDGDGDGHVAFHVPSPEPEPVVCVLPEGQGGLSEGSSQGLSQGMNHGLGQGLSQGLQQGSQREVGYPVFGVLASGADGVSLKQKRPLEANVVEEEEEEEHMLSGKRAAVKDGKRVRFEDNAERSTGMEVCVRPHLSVPSPWRPVAMPESSAAPDRRWGATFTRLDADTAILLGGESEAAGFFKEMAIFNMNTKTWLKDCRDTPDFLQGVGRAWHTTTCWGANLFVFGGEVEEGGRRTQTNDCLIYDSTFYTWFPPELSGTPPSPRAGHCAALLPVTPTSSASLVVWGGINGNKWLNDLYILEGMCAWSKIRPPNKSARPAARSYATLTPTDRCLVLFGGNNRSRAFNSVHFLDIRTKSWTEPVIVGRTPQARTGHCATASEDGKRVIVYGGWDDQGVHRIFFSDVWELTIVSSSEARWKCLFAGDNSSRHPGPRAGAALCGAVGPGQQTFLFGGWHQISYFNDITELILPPQQ